MTVGGPMGDIANVVGSADGVCAASPDLTHCMHWWDTPDEPCCFCGDNEPNPDSDTYDDDEGGDEV